MLDLGADDGVPQQGDKERSSSEEDLNICFNVYVSPSVDSAHAEREI